MFDSKIVIDGHGHLCGRLASNIAEQLRCGQKIAIVRCEDLVLSGPIWRHKVKFSSFLRKKSNSNPRRSSHIHFRTPAKMFWRMLRGMVGHKSARGKKALENVEVYEGIPPQYEKTRRMLLPKAQRFLRIKEHRKVTRLGDLSILFGWKNQALLTKLENRRKERSKIDWEKRQELATLQKKAENEAFKELTPREQEVLRLVNSA